MKEFGRADEGRKRRTWIIVGTRKVRASLGSGHDAAASRHTYVIDGYILRYEAAGVRTGGKECLDGAGVAGVPTAAYASPGTSSSCGFWSCA